MILSQQTYEIKKKMVQPSSTNKTQLKFDFENVHTKIINFTDIFRPIYYFARFCGQLPFTIVRNSTDEFHQSRVTKCDALWFIFSISLYLAVSFRTAQILTFQINANETEHVLFVGNAALHIMTMSFGILKITMDMYNRHKLVDILNKFTKFDHEVGRKNIFHKLYFISWITISFFVQHR